MLETTSVMFGKYRVTFSAAGVTQDVAQTVIQIQIQIQAVQR